MSSSVIDHENFKVRTDSAYQAAIGAEFAFCDCCETKTDAGTDSIFYGVTLRREQEQRMKLALRA